VGGNGHKINLYNWIFLETKDSPFDESFVSILNEISGVHLPMEQDLIIHIAFADDHTILRKGVISLLDSIGGVVVDIEADDGQELLDKLEQVDVLPHICMIDFSMPQLDGYGALLQIRKRWPDMKTLILTAFNSELYVIRMMQAGANGYLLKKSDVAELKEALISIHNHGYYYSECANSTLFHLVKTNSIKLQHFTESEIEMLKYCCSEFSYGQIAQKMNTTLSSVEGIRDRLFLKLNLNSRVGLALFAVQFGLVKIESNYENSTIIPIQKQNRS